MRSGILSCNLTVAKKTFLRFWPLWALYTVIWLILLPVRGLMLLQMDAEIGERAAGSFLKNFAATTVSGMSEPALVLAVAFGLLAAMAVCSHLYSARSANFMGALPARREGLFLSHYLSGLAMLILPTLLTFVLTLLVEIAGGAVEWIPLVFWLGCACAMDFFFYSFAVCIGMFAGHLLALPVFYAIFNVLAEAVYTMLGWAMRTFYYGFTDFGAGMRTAVSWLTPVWRLTMYVKCSVIYIPADSQTLQLDRIEVTMDHFEVAGLFELGIYTLAGLALAVCALLLYRRRQLETAGDVVAVRVMRPVFKYGVALCAGLFFGHVTSTVLNTAELGLMISILLWGVAGYFVAQMLLDKSFRVFRKWKGAAAVAAVLLLLFAVVGFDLTGFESRVPAAEEVESVRIYGLESQPSDGAYYINVCVDNPETIERVIALHQTAIEQRDGTGSDSVSVELEYTLSDGSTLSRRYNLTYSAGQISQEGSVAWAVDQLLSDRDLVWKAYGFDEAMALEADGVRLTSAVYGDEGYYYGEDAETLLNAVVRDFEANRIGVRGLPYRGEWVPPLTFTWAVSTTDWHTVEIAVTDTATETLKALEELGKQ